MACPTFLELTTLGFLSAACKGCGMIYVGYPSLHYTPVTAEQETGWRNRVLPTADASATMEIGQG